MKVRVEPARRESHGGHPYMLLCEESKTRTILIGYGHLFATENEYPSSRWILCFFQANDRGDDDDDDADLERRRKGFVDR